MKPYVVRQGDYLTRIASREGFSADEVWNHAKNKDLKARRDPNVLDPGDILFVPDGRPPAVAVSLGQANAYVGHIPDVKVNLVLRLGDRELANEPYVVEGLGEPPPSGKSDGQGRVALDVPVNVTSVRLILPKRGIASLVLVGHLDPIETESGQRGRLGNLGYDGEAGNGDDLRRALRDFQAASGLEPTGLADQKTRDALAAAHRC